MADVPDGLYRDPTSGAVVHVRGGKVLLNQGGKIVPVAPEHAGTAVLSGDYAPASTGDIASAEAAAKPYSAGEALQAFGERAATGVYGGATAVPRGLAAAAEGLYRGAGAPISGPSVSGLGEEGLAEALGGKEYAAERARRAAEHPVASFLGELTGQTAGALGVAAPAAAAETAAGKLTAKAAAGKAFVGAVEGAGFGGSAAAEQAYIQKTDLTGEKVIAAMGPMAVLGGGAALLGVGASRLFKRDGSRAAASLDSPVLTAATEPGPSGFRKFLSEFAEERTAKAIGARGTDVRKLGRTAEAAEANLRKMTRDVIEGELEDGTKIFKAVQSQDELLSNLQRAEAETGAKLDKFRQRVWRHVEEGGGKLKPDMDAFYRKVEDDVVAPLRASSVEEVRSKASAVESKLQELKDIGPTPTLEQLTRYRQDLATIIYPKPAGPGLPALAPVAARELQQFERTLESTIEAATDKAAATLPGVKAGEYVALKSKFRSYKQAAEIAGKADLQDLGNRVVSPSDYITGVAGAAVSGNPVAGLASAVAHKAVREHGSAVMAVLADRLAKNLDSRIDGALGRVLSAKLPEVSAAPKLRALQPAAMAAFAKRGEDQRDAYVRHVREVYAANQPMQSTAKLAENLGQLYSHAPQTAQSATATVNRAAQYLATKIPASAVQVNTFGPPKQTTSISDEDLHKFMTSWTAVNNPLSILDDMEKNMLTQEQVQAVKAVYPELYQQIQQRALEMLSKQREPPPYNARIQLDLLLDLNGAGEPSMAPDFQRVLMTVVTTQQQQTKPPAGAKPASAAQTAQRYRTLSSNVAASTG